MKDLDYVVSRIKKASSIELSEHAEKRADIRGIEPEKIRSTLENGDILGFRSNNNPNVGIEYSETYLVLTQSQDSELYYLPVYFTGDSVLVTTVLKLSESNLDVLEW